ncbi:hypothetical protein [Salinimicrobium sp. TH3]|uniref:hypothetical protein n=1 Tax=Salinimicrobium sp. TH3 TaxID=2997342 RepID=UPI00227650C6|nr:hypothetical protein [Salinimicrobium sp. TH3]MCY2687502.1 hypothetical protein [Salinimicrobium sp. TH3]
MRGKYFFSWIFFLLFLTGCSPDDPAKAPSAHRNDLVLGASARDYLSDELFTSMELEVVYVTGHEPAEEALQSLSTFLNKYINKPDGISIKKRAIASPQDDTYSIEEIKSVEKKNRTAFSKDKKLATFIFFANNKSEDSENRHRILGKAYMNTSMVVFENEIDEMAGTISRSEVQTVTLHHEFGHLFGLVDNGSPAQSAHEDTNKEYRAHCNVDGCLMAAAIDISSSPLSFFENGQKVIDFDEKCKLDLKANGGK